MQELARRLVVSPNVESATEVECELLGKWGSFGWWLQGFLFVVCSFSLVAKRFTDKVRRPWIVWFMDTSKQGCGCITIHFCNIGLAKAFGEWLESDADPCNWYWINLLLDCTVGCGIVFLLLRLLQCFYRLKSIGRPELAAVGEYGEPPNKRIFFRQLADWQCIVFAQKFMLACAVVGFQQPFTLSAEWVLGLLDPYPRVKLITVMVATPLLLNVFYLWMADNFLQGGKQSAEEVQARSALVNASAQGTTGQTPAVVGLPLAPAPRGEDEAFSGDEEDRVISFEKWKQRNPWRKSQCQGGRLDKPRVNVSRAAA